MSSNWNDSRPLSPFTSIWRWHITMVTSILHRASGVVLLAGSVLFCLWLLALALGEERYTQMMGILASAPGRLVLFGCTLALFFHLLNGVRHLVWDMGHGFEPKTANRASWLILVLAILLSLALWTTGYWMFEAFPGQTSH